jgi:hypothetical protein
MQCRIVGTKGLGFCSDFSIAFSRTNGSSWPSSDAALLLITCLQQQCGVCDCMCVSTNDSPLEGQALLCRRSII